MNQTPNFAGEPVATTDPLDAEEWDTVIAGLLADTEYQVLGALVLATAPDTDPPDVDITRSRPTATCPWSTPIIIGATVTDLSDIGSVTLNWSGPGSPGSAAMSRSASEWSGVLGVEQLSGTWSYLITAVDSAGNPGTASGTIVVGGC